MWYDKYMGYFGDFDAFPPELFAQTKARLDALEKGPVEVSFVVIAYNEEKNLLPCILSLADLKTDRSVEVIVVDNNSKDRTRELIDRLGVRTVFQPKQGHGHARQAGMDAARGKYHFSGDSDSLYRPTHIDAMLKQLEKPGTSCVFAPYGFYPDGKKSRLQLSFYEFFRDLVVRFRAVKRPELSVGGAAFAFRTEDGRKFGWRTDIKRGEDGSMLWSLNAVGKPRLVMSRKARIASSSRRLDADGSMGAMIWQRFKKDLLRFGSLFKRSKGYTDHESNLREDREK